MPEKSTESSRTLYTKFLSTVANVYGDVDHVKGASHAVMTLMCSDITLVLNADGQFGAMMSVSLMNEAGIFTLLRHRLPLKPIALLGTGTRHHSN